MLPANSTISISTLPWILCVKIGAADIPMLIIYNKCDKTSYTHPQIQNHHLYLCAKDDKEVDYLFKKLQKPYSLRKK